jgi:hypothetical protein
MQDIRERLPNGNINRETLVGHESSDLAKAFGRRRRAAEQRLERGETESLTITEARRIGRNDQCPCGSGAKFKLCCGSRLAPDDERIADGGTNERTEEEGTRGRSETEMARHAGDEDQPA